MTAASPVETLLALLDLSTSDEKTFVGHLPSQRSGLVFGGLSMGQALMAAQQTVTDWRCRYAQFNFINRAHPDETAAYHVEPLSDGRTNRQRYVQAKQATELILTATASFQVDCEGPDHQATMPSAQDPSQLRSRREMRFDELTAAGSKMADVFREPLPVEIWPVEPESFLAPKPAPAANCVWIKAGSSPGDAQILHQCLLLFGLDLCMIDTAMRPNAISWTSRDMMIASLNHTTWFHHPIRIDDWMLVKLDSPCATGGRGLITAEVFTQSGTLVASATQEAALRVRHQCKAPKG